MNPLPRAAVFLLAVLGGAVVAEEQSRPMTAQEAMAYAKRMDAKERSSLMDQTRQIDDQIAQLQAQVRTLQVRLAQSPKYFDDPLNNPLRP